MGASGLAWDTDPETAVKNKIPFLPVLLLALQMVLCGDVLAHRKTDVVTLYNGDRITGEIKSLFGGLLEYSTDTMGTIKVEWQHIAQIESEYNYEIRLSDGTRHFGSLDKPARPGQLLAGALGEDLEMEMIQVVELRPIEDTVLERLDLRLSAGYSFTRASSVAQTTFNTEIGYEDRKARNTLTARFTLTDTDEETTKSGRINVARQLWTRREGIFRLLFGNYETNDELSLDHRLSAGLGLGRFFIDRQGMHLLGAAGLQVLTERSTDGAEQQSTELFLSTKYSAWRFDTPELDLDISFDLYPSLTESGRVRGDTDITLSWELVKDFFWDISAYGTYDNEAEGDKQFDYGITTGIGWKY
jgi:hypothetical protein